MTASLAQRSLGRPGRVHPALNAGVLQACLGTATDLRTSIWHGESHWRAVAQAGWYIAAATPSVDPIVVYLFAALHDTQRESESKDPAHGERAAWVAVDLYGRGRLPITWDQYIELFHALYRHNGGLPEAGTIGACFDADRLNLWRVGKTPNPEFLSTPYAKRPEVIDWARKLVTAQREHPQPWASPVYLLSWSQLREAYAVLVARRQEILP